MLMQKKRSHQLSWVNKLHAFHKLVIALAIGILSNFIFIDVEDLIIRIMIGWDIFCIVLLLLTWASYFTINSEQIRELCKKQDESRVVIFLIILVSALASMAAVFDLFINESPYVLVAIGGLLLSWLLVHTIFASRYAHLFYGNDKEDPQIHAGGLEFPSEKKPDYLDFAYFSFVIGMTFQVSDVQVTSKRIRRLVLIHGFVSFCFNTFVVALMINFIGSIMENKKK